MPNVHIRKQRLQLEDTHHTYRTDVGLPVILPGLSSRSLQAHFRAVLLAPMSAIYNLVGSEQHVLLIDLRFCCAIEFADAAESTSEQRQVPATKSVPSSPHGTPRGAARQPSFSHNVPPIAATVSAAAAALGMNTPFQPGTSYSTAGQFS